MAEQTAVNRLVVGSNPAAGATNNIIVMYISTPDQNLIEIKQFLDDNDIEYSTEYDNFCLWFGNPNGKRSYEIEYVKALDYPIDYPKYGIKGVDKKFFFKKSYKAEHEYNSFILWIKDYEWEHPRKREVLKSYILHAANKTPNKWYARDCYVKEVSPKEGGLFEAKHCFYGKRGASLRLGLYSKKQKNDVPADTLLMIYTFGANFFAKDETIIEVIRVGTRKFSNVVGGSSKLFKYFIRNYEYLQVGKKQVKVEKIKFYSDYDHNLGGSMENLGFKFEKYSEGGFMNYWVEEGKVKHRRPTQHKWVMEQMAKGKVIAVPNAGVKVFTARRSELI